MGIVALLGGLSACVATISAPVLPTPIRLAAPAEFTLYTVDSATQALRPHCTAQRVDGNVLAVRGDTVLLGNVSVAPPIGGRVCAPADSLRLIVSRDPTVRAEVDYVAHGRTAALVLGATLLGVFWFGMYLIALSLGAS